MVVIEKQNTIKTSGIKNSVSFGIKDDGLAHIFSILRSQMYSDKILAVIREYSCNSQDANVEAGCPEKPIEVSLPNQLSPLFKVRDFGNGLSEKEIQEIYCFYGSSTKRNTNSLVGQFGLGSKSGFAYSDSFIVNSFVNGTKTSYSAYIDASQIGQIAKLSSEPTTEPNGVEIVVPVKEGDFNQFKEKAQSFFQHFKVRPIIKGQTIQWNEKKPIFSGSFWEIYNVSYSYSKNLVAVMGGVGYSIDDTAISGLNDKLKKFTSYTTGVIDFNIGDLEVSSSRESLQYTERTQKVLAAKIEKAFNELITQVQIEFDKKETHFQAMCFGGSVFSNYYYDRNNHNSYEGLHYLMDKASITYKGKAINNQITFRESSGIKVSEYKKSSRSTRIISQSVNYDRNVSLKTVLVWNDEQRNNGISARVHDLVVAGKEVFVCEFNDDQSRKTWMAKESVIDSDFTKMSDLKPTTVVSTPSGITYAPKSKKHSEKAFTYTPFKHWSSTCSNYWTSAEVDIDNDSGVYLEIDGFQYKNSARLDHPQELNNVINQFKAVGIDIPTIYGFKKDIAAKVAGSKNWQTLWVYLAQAMNKHLVSKKLLQEFIDKKAQIDIKNECNVVTKIDLKDVDVTGVFGKLKNAYSFCENKAKDKDLSTFINIVDNFGLTIDSVKPTFDLRQMVNKMQETYPMLSFCSYSYDRDDMKKVADYINMVDSLSKT